MTNKRVLFIHIDFYEYNQRIVNKMCEFGYDVDCFCEDANFNFFEKLIYKFNPQYAINKNSKKQDEFINTLAIQKKQYEFIFVIKGAKLTNKFMTELKQLNPNARFILYLWDDIVRVESFFENKKFYDKIFTFDRIDAEQNGLSFLPLFFCSEFKTNNNKKKIDIYFSGWEQIRYNKFRKLKYG
ncbi:hypothetical protein [Sporomusa sp. KB1]|uniref:hypothetical protein n=1 Tax=Sporomusa sp. KB1 TaxID=943346 RepID=UPI00119D2CDC|nr:hypothetical protein [Sporomusa sp. KB1]